MTPRGAAPIGRQRTANTGSRLSSLPVTITRFPALDEPRGRRIFTSWDALVVAAATPREASSKASLPLWSPGTYIGDYRALDRVEATFALGYDDDETPLPWKEAVALWSSVGARAIVHTTASHKPDSPRYRAIVLLARPVSGEEYRILWRAIARRLAHAGHVVGRAASDPSRCWYSPGRIGDGEYLHATIDGPAIDVDTLLADEMVRRTRADDARRRALGSPVACTSRYAAAALRRAAAKVRIAVEGARNDTLNAAAFGLGQLVGAGTLERSSVEKVLAEAAELAGLTTFEIAATLRSGLDAGQRHPREVRA